MIKRSDIKFNYRRMVTSTEAAAAAATVSPATSTETDDADDADGMEDRPNDTNNCNNNSEEEAVVETLVEDECFLLRNLWSVEEQLRLYEYILQHDKTPSQPQPACMNPSPKTLILGQDGNPSLQCTPDKFTVVNELVEDGIAALSLSRNTKAAKTKILGRISLSRYKSLSMATIRYEAPHDKFPPHVDHCDNSVVFLTTLGCTANFMVQGPTTPKIEFKFKSGDLLIFNASSQANILHAVTSIEDNTAPDLLTQKYPALQHQRLGVQCRMYF
mmetsp:Transcript_117639/g.329402  ORF Transcript_117639/g.329402 Transcript_117639/m.329402 type:complete len:273 (-) Transcript_117639:29-847(-)